MRRRDRAVGQPSRSTSCAFGATFAALDGLSIERVRLSPRAPSRVASPGSREAAAAAAADGGRGPAAARFPWTERRCDSRLDGARPRGGRAGGGGAGAGGAEGAARDGARGRPRPSRAAGRAQRQGVDRPLPRQARKRVAFGAKVSFVLSGRSRPRSGSSRGPARSRSHGVVVRSHGGLGIRLADGKLLRLGSPSARRQSGVIDHARRPEARPAGRRHDHVRGRRRQRADPIGDGDTSLCDNPNCKATFDGVVDTIGDDGASRSTSATPARSASPPRRRSSTRSRRATRCTWSRRQSREDGSYTAKSVELTDDQGDDDPGADGPCADGSCDVSADGTVTRDRLRRRHVHPARGRRRHWSSWRRTTCSARSRSASPCTSTRRGTRTRAT